MRGGRQKEDKQAEQQYIKHIGSEGIKEKQTMDQALLQKDEDSIITEGRKKKKEKR